MYRKDKNIAFLRTQGNYNSTNNITKLKRIRLDVSKRLPVLHGQDCRIMFTRNCIVLRSSSFRVAGITTSLLHTTSRECDQHCEKGTFLSSKTSFGLQPPQETPHISLIERKRPLQANPLHGGRDNLIREWTLF